MYVCYHAFDVHIPSPCKANERPRHSRRRIVRVREWLVSDARSRFLPCRRSHKNHRPGGAANPFKLSATASRSSSKRSA